MQSGEKFTVGKATRDVRYKHHVDDPRLYQCLLDHGYRIKLIGATCIKDRLPAHPELEVRGEVHQSEIVDFLLGLDCLIYRTASRHPEGFGLCILEAMTLGVPIIAHRAGGYADIIEHGKNGLLFDNNEQALDYIALLKNNPDLHERIRITAISTAESYAYN
jgi:glycosyltransferase involved in cell wall biosynthesis